jgi:hypothetical protein
MNTKTILKSSVAATALFALAAPVSTTAMAADDSFSSGQKTKLVMSGFISRAIWNADDGTSEKTFMSDSPGIGSRIRWVASGTLSDSVTAGATMEMTMPINYSEGSAKLQGTIIGAAGQDGANLATWTPRHEYVWVNHKKFGKLSVGHTNVASTGRGEISAQGTDYSRSGRNFGRALTFINTTAAANAVSTNSVGGVLGNLDISRTDNLRYDLPTFGGIKLSVSRHASSETSVGLNYAGKFGAIAVSAGAGYIDQSSATGSSNFTALGSISVAHDSGLNFSYQTGKKNFAGSLSKSTSGEAPRAGLSSGNADTLDTNNLGGRDDPYFHGVQLGYLAPKLVSVGKTAFALTHMSAQNIKENDGDATSWSIRVKQSFDALGASMSLSYQKYAYDAEGETVVGTKVNEDYADIDVIALQTVFNF